MNANVNPNLANMNVMGGGPVGAPVPMMNNGAVAPQVAGGPRQMTMPTESQRTLLNTYIYEYFLRHQMFDCARSLLNGDHQVNVMKDGANRRRDENGNLIGNGLGDDPMDTDSKDDIDAKLPDDLPAPKLPMPASESSFLYEWFCLFWDIFHAQRTKGGNGPVNQYVSHTQQQSRMRQNQQQELLRQMRPDGMAAQQQYHSQMMRNMQNGGMAMNMQKGNLARAAMANNQNNPQAMQMLQQHAKQTQMQRDPSDMDGNRQRPSSPGSGENAPSPSKRPRLDGAPNFPNQPGMMPNGRPQQGMPGQQVGTTPNVAQAQQMLITNGINPASLTQQQFTTFSNQPPAVQAKSIATYAANLQQHQASQMPNKTMPNAPGPQGQGSPMMAQGQEGAGLAAYYNAGEMGPGGIRPGPGGAQAGGGSNHALQDYQMQLMLLEQQNKKRLMMARQEQDNMGGGAMPRDGPAGPGGPGAPPGPNGQPFPETSPQGARTGASPNPTEQMKRGTPQMNNAGIPSPLPEGAQSRGSPNPMNFMGNQMDPNMAPHFFKGMGNQMDGNMAGNPQMNGGMRPPSSHPGQQFNGQMNPQQMMVARQQQQQAQQAQQAQQQQQQQQQPPQQQGQPQQAGQGGQPVQWQQGGPNGQMVPQGPQGSVQGTPQQRSMPPPSAPAGANSNRTSTSSPQQAAAAPPTPSQSNKAAPKKKDTKNTKAKAAAGKKSGNNNLNSGTTPAADGADAEAATPATPITPVTTANFTKNGQNAAVPAVPNGQAAAPAPAPQPQVAPQAQHDANQNGGFMDNTNPMVDFGAMAFADPLVSDNVLNDFDFDSFLHEDGDNQAFDFNTGSFGMEGANEIGAD
ncbi:SOM1 protein [Colletotrichum paranaense]|uniref:SOM1 protein n=3 Tax=Colletotrichum acutatum species complex TaxID=2707335 RepID=A0A9Q0B0H3_9PEZI|nr:SOM1 protein [Colletotrichum costaricense]XP_060352044.1 SOM1 protein [Colletotrichum paranaense]XP_060398050.1 SOM1 protein [Colletotrichum abscissum]KAI3541190.1 SOM1 protein [Colletotrichum abscissum]KAK1495674.1 SOM1 protein [Colletotrichum abscissum]KAK1526270.1 SOM1 protein [Colletotrichum costaricense]KAK1542918.1 SOM1 protein [Colletotrichum paranaense]